MKATHAIRLVAMRDLSERIRSKSFLLSTGITILAVVALLIAPMFFSDDEVPFFQIGLVGTAPANLDSQLEAALGDAARGVQLNQFAGVAAAEDALDSGFVDIVIIEDREVIIGPDTDRNLATVTPAVVGVARFLEAAGDLGLEQDDLNALIGGVAVRDISEASVESDENRGFAFVGTILLFISIVTFGQWILLGVVEEKSNRVVEVVLGAVKPHHLMAGKIIGIGSLALAQVVVIILIVVTLAPRTADLELPSAAAGVIASLIVWFLLGFTFYAAAYAAAGALVSRQEEAQNAAFPLTLMLMAAYFVATFSFEGDNIALRVASLLPPFAPMTMPMRMAGGDATLIEVVVSLGLMVVGTYGLVRLAGRIYAGGLLRSGAKVKIRDALRSTRT